jgi:hypothetical protein
MVADVRMLSGRDDESWGGGWLGGRDGDSWGGWSDMVEAVGAL